MTDESSISGLSGERRAAIRARLEQLAIQYHKVQEGEYGCNGIACAGVHRLCLFAFAAVQEAEQEWLAAVDQITQERDDLQRKCSEAFDSEVHTAYDTFNAKTWMRRAQAAEAVFCEAHQPPHSVCPCCEAVHADDERQKAEAALVVLTQRQEQVKALAEKWRRRSEVLSGQIRGKADIVRQCADDLEKALGLLGSAAPEDAPR